MMLAHHEEVHENILKVLKKKSRNLERQNGLKQVGLFHLAMLKTDHQDTKIDIKSTHYFIPRKVYM